MASYPNGPAFYKPLNNAENEIRLLSLLPSDNEEPSRDSIIRGTLKYCSLDDDPPYNALSYVWGDPNVTRAVIVDGHEVQVTTNLADALFQLRRNGVDTIWADALCINQRDDKEKSYQVQKMRTIYGKAREVLAWLGTGDDDSDRAIKQMHALASLATEFGINSYHEVKDIFYNSSTKSGTPFAQQLRHRLDEYAVTSGLDFSPTVRLLQRRFWTRVWTLQEVVLAKSTQVLCGSASIPWTKTVRSVSLLDIIRINSYVQNWNDVGTLDDCMPPAKWHTWDLPAAVVLASVASRACPLDLATLYIKIGSATLQATDPKDRVFGLVGFLEPFDTNNRAPVIVDYTAQCRDIYAEATLLVMEQATSLHYLKYAGLVNQGRPELELPSWSFDWRRAPASFVVPPRFRPWASEPDQPRFRPWPSQPDWFAFRRQKQTAITTGVLILEGVIVDTVSEVVSYSGEIKYLQQTVDRLTDAFRQNARRSGHPMKRAAAQEAVCRTIYMDDNVMEHRRLNAEDVKLLRKWLQMQPHSSKTTSLRRWVRAGFTRRMNLLKRDSTNSVRVDKFYMVGTFIVSRQGYIGKTPHEVELGDLICIFNGVDTPCIIRPGENGAYRLFGAAYVHGIMDGEFMASNPPIIQIKLY